LFESNEPFVRDAESLRAQVGEVEPLALFGGPLLIEPHGTFHRRTAGQFDREVAAPSIQPLSKKHEDD
jgi:hypothetical protein